MPSGCGITGALRLNTLAFALSLVILGLSNGGVNTDLIVAWGNVTLSGGTTVSLSVYRDHSTHHKADLPIAAHLHYISEP